MLPADLLPTMLCSMPVFGVGQTVALVVALLALVVSGFVSGSEIAYFSLTPAQCEELDETPRGASIRRLLDKPERRVVDLKPDYVGCDVPDEFVVGYGLDYDQKYRNLPYIGALKREIYE